jgi:hypothetical protein
LHDLNSRLARWEVLPFIRTPFLSELNRLCDNQTGTEPPRVIGILKLLIWIHITRSLRVHTINCSQLFDCEGTKRKAQEAQEALHSWAVPLVDVVKDALI